MLAPSIDARRRALGYVTIFAVALAAALASSFLVTKDYYWLALFTGAAAIVIGLWPAAKTLASHAEWLTLFNAFTLWFTLSASVGGILSLSGGSQWLQNFEFGTAEYNLRFFMIFVYSILALMVLYVGYFNQFGHALGKHVPKIQFLPGSRTGLKTLVLMFAFIGGAGAFLLLREAGTSAVVTGPAPFIERGLLEGGLLYTNFLIEFALMGLIILIVGRYPRPFDWTERGLALALIGVLFVRFLAVGMKGHILIPIFQVLVVRHFLFKGTPRAQMRYDYILAAVVAVLSIPVAQVYRHGGVEALREGLGPLLGGAQVAQLLIASTVGRSAGADMFFLALAKTPSEHPFQYGLSFLSRLPTALVPRAIWSDKPWSFGIEFNQKYLDVNILASVSPSVIGELYLNFHLAGIFLGFVTIGVVLRAVHAYCLERAHSREGVIIYSAILVNFMVFVDGPITEAVVFTIMKMLPILVFAALSRIFITPAPART